VAALAHDGQTLVVLLADAAVLQLSLGLAQNERYFVPVETEIHVRQNSLIKRQQHIVFK